jgi:hypothetical protein
MGYGRKNPATIKIDNPNVAELESQLAQNVSQIVQNTKKIEGIISVKETPYNAKGDGITDDTNAIQTAINDASTAGKKLYIPAGRYVVTSTINIPSKAGFLIVGDGNRNTMLSVKHNLNAVQLLDGASHVLENIFILPHSEAYDGQFTGIYIKNGLSIQLNNVTIFSAKNGLVLEGDSYHCTTKDLYVFNYYQNGVYFKKDTNGMAPNGNDIHLTIIYGRSTNQVGSIGINIEDGSINTFRAGEISGCEIAIYQELGYRNFFNGIWIERCLKSLKLLSGSVVMDSHGAFLNDVSEGAIVFNNNGKVTPYNDLTDNGFKEDKSLKGLWLFNEGEGNKSIDKSGNGKHATLLGTPTWSDEGTWGKSAYYDQADGRLIEIPNDTVDFSKPYTFGINYSQISAGNVGLLREVEGSKWLFASGNAEILETGLYNTPVLEIKPWVSTGRYGSQRTKNIWVFIYVDPINKKIELLDPFGEYGKAIPFENPLPLTGTPEEWQRTYITGRRGAGLTGTGTISMAFMFQRKLSLNEIYKIVNVEKPFADFNSKVNHKMILVSPNGKQFKITVDDAGVISSTLI